LTGTKCTDTNASPTGGPETEKQNRKIENSGHDTGYFFYLYPIKISGIVRRNRIYFYKK
jgi:hypothetical protein